MTNIEQQARELKPCPFCGGPAQIWHQKKNHREQTYVLCNEALCGTSKSGVGGKRADREADAIASWNRRALTPTGENAKHVEVLRDMVHPLLGSQWSCDVVKREALEFAIRALSAPDNAEGETIEELANRFIGDTGWMPDEWQDWRNEFHRDLRRAANPTPAATAYNAEAVEDDDTPSRPTELQIEYARGYSDGVKFGEQCANPTPAARASVSEEDLATARRVANWLDPKMQVIAYEGRFVDAAAAIRRVVQAVKGEG